MFDPARDTPAPPLLRAPLPYFGSVALWRGAIAAGGFRFRENEHYQRRTQRNRCELATAQGRHRLSVPLLAGKHERCPIAAVAVDYSEDWPRRHFQTLVAAYGSAPYWPEYGACLEPLFRRKPTRLWDWNWALVEWVRREIDPTLVMAVAQDWRPGVDEVAPPMGPDRTLPAYPQVFTERTGYLSNLSVVDLLMCRGPRARDYLSPRSPPS